MVNGGIARFLSGDFAGLFFSCSVWVTLWISLWLSESRIAEAGKLREDAVEVVPGLRT